jgi:hypothetical protein
MSVKVAKNRFILNPSLKLWGEFYQHLLSNISSFQALGDSLIEKAELAKALRRTEILEEIALIFASFPIREYQFIGQYYQALGGYLKGRRPQLAFEEVLEQSRTYKARALIGLAALEAQKGNFESEMSFFTQALKFADTHSVTLEIRRGIALVKAKEGFHTEAVNDLEKCYSLSRYTDPYSYYQYLNSLAVELGELGRIEEAGNICKVILASPYLSAYPEWRETAQDIAGRGCPSRSIISFAQKPKPRNILLLPKRSIDVEKSVQNPFQKRASVTELAEWKKKMGKEPNGPTKNLENATEKDLFYELMELVAKRQFSRDQLHKMIEFARKLPDDPTPESSKD